MRDPWIGTDATVFVLFFGLALLDALQARSWLRVACWLAIGAVFLLASRRAMHR